MLRNVWMMGIKESKNWPFLFTECSGKRHSLLHHLRNLLIRLSRSLKNNIYLILNPIRYKLFMDKILSAKNGGWVVGKRRKGSYQIASTDSTEAIDNVYEDKTCGNIP